MGGGSSAAGGTVGVAGSRALSSAGNPMPKRPEYPTCSASRRVSPMRCRCAGCGKFVTAAIQSRRRERGAGFSIMDCIHDCRCVAATRPGASQNTDGGRRLAQGVARPRFRKPTISPYLGPTNPSSVWTMSSCDPSLLVQRPSDNCRAACVGWFPIPKSAIAKASLKFAVVTRKISLQLENADKRNERLFARGGFRPIADAHRVRPPPSVLFFGGPRDAVVLRTRRAGHVESGLGQTWEILLDGHVTTRGRARAPTSARRRSSRAGVRGWPPGPGLRR